MHSHPIFFFLELFPQAQHLPLGFDESSITFISSECAPGFLCILLMGFSRYSFGIDLSQAHTTDSKFSPVFVAFSAALF